MGDTTSTGFIASAPRAFEALASSRAGILSRLMNLGANGYLKIAAALHVAALVVAYSAGSTLLHLSLIGLGLVLILVAINLPQTPRFVSPPQATPASAPEVSAPQTIVPNLPLIPARSPTPSPLPFIGERIVLNPHHPSISRLADAAARLAAISTVRTHPWQELMARVSHELRTPLNAVIGFSDVMNAELLGPVGHPRYREYARHIRDCGRELLKSAEDTLAITCLLDSHQGATNLASSFDLGEIVSDAWSFYSDIATHRQLSLQTTIPADIELKMERRALRQILINLFSEAVHRANDGGTIGFTTCAHHDLVQIEIFVRGRRDEQSVGEASLAICLARALLEMQGAALVEVDDPASTWRALTVLKRAAQPDLFTLPFAFEERRPAHYC